MKIKTTYKFRKDNITYMSSRLLEDSELLETYRVLYPDYQYDIIDKKGNNLGQFVILKDNDDSSNYSQKKWKSYDLDLTEREIISRNPVDVDRDLLLFFKQCKV